MRYLIIGLGIYGFNLATDLTDMGHEVIGADIRASNVDAIKDYISTAYIIDSTDESSLGVLPLKNVDVVIVAIGENFGASVKTVAILKKMGVKHIYARAIDKLHQSIMEGMNVERILTPEQRAAKDLVYEMELGTHVDAINMTADTYILKFDAPEYFIGMKYADINMEKTYNLRLVAASRPTPTTNILGSTHLAPAMLDITTPDLRVETGDTFLCLGSSKAFRALFRNIN